MKEKSGNVKEPTWDYTHIGFSICKRNDNLYHVIKFDYEQSLEAPVQVNSLFSTEDYGEAQERFKIEVSNSGILGGVRRLTNSNL